MAIALESRGLVRSYRAGAGRCAASLRVLRGIDLVLHAGDAVGVLGERGSGKSTLLLCLAGLLGADAGDVRWFGRASLAAAAQHVLLHTSRADLLRAGAAGCAHIHLVDVASIDGLSVDLDHWIERRRLAGDAMVVATRHRALLPPDLPVFLLAQGRLRRIDEQSRVAEGARARWAGGPS